MTDQDRYRWARDQRIPLEVRWAGEREGTVARPPRIEVHDMDSPDYDATREFAHELVARRFAELTGRSTMTVPTSLHQLAQGNRMMVERAFDGLPEAEQKERIAAVKQEKPDAQPMERMEEATFRYGLEQRLVPDRPVEQWKDVPLGLQIKLRQAFRNLYGDMPASVASDEDLFSFGRDGDWLPKPEKPEDGPKLAERLWGAWKGSPTRAEALALQAATTRVLGALNYLTPEQQRQAAEWVASSGMGPPRHREEAVFQADLDAYVRAQYEVTQWLLREAGVKQMDLYRAVVLPKQVVDMSPKPSIEAKSWDDLDREQKKQVMLAYTKAGRGMASLKDWAEMTSAETFEWAKQHGMATVPWVATRKSWSELSDHQKTKVYDQYVEGFGLPKDSSKTPAEQRQARTLVWDHMDNGQRFAYAQKQRLNLEKLDDKPLPDIMLLKNNLSSWTTQASVANEWEGVGVSPDHVTHERVVLRGRIPAGAILSLPVYGKNDHSESEVVVMGAPWIKWDAWFDTAPEFERRPLDQEERDAA